MTENIRNTGQVIGTIMIMPASEFDQDAQVVKLSELDALLELYAEQGLSVEDVRARLVVELI